MKEIINFMRLSLLKCEVPLSWGISNIEVSETRLAFDVAGCNEQGRVFISETEKCITARINNRKKSFANATELLNWLDKVVERRHPSFSED